MSQSIASAKPQDIFACPGCGKIVVAEFYLQHMNGDETHGQHTLHVYNLVGVGPQIVSPPTPGTKGPKMLEVPYLGRVRADAFIGQALVWITIGVLLAFHELHLV